MIAADEPLEHVVTKTDIDIKLSFSAVSSRHLTLRIFQLFLPLYCSEQNQTKQQDRQTECSMALLGGSTTLWPLKISVVLQVLFIKEGTLRRVGK